MSYLNPKELIRAKQLIEECKYDKADQLIKIFEEKGGHNLHDIVSCHLLKSELLYWGNLFEDGVKLAEQTYKESLGLGKSLLSVDILLIMAHELLCLYQTDKAHDITKQGEELLGTLTQELPAESKQREAYIAFLKGWVYEQKTEVDPAIKQFELSISLRKKINAKKEIAYSLVGLAHVFMYRKGEFNRALEYLEQGLALAEESGNKWMIGYCILYIGWVYLLKGELDRSIKFFKQSLRICNEINTQLMKARVLNSLGVSYALRGEINNSIRTYEQSLEIFKEYDSKIFIAGAFTNLSENYKMKGDLDRALEYIEKSMELYLDLGSLRHIAFNHDSLIQIFIDLGDLERAQKSLRDLEQLNGQLRDKIVNLMYLFDKALLLKTSPRAHNRVKAEELLRQILEEEDLSIDILTRVLLNLCELLLVELQITNDIEILEEIKPLITQLLELSEQSNSFWILGETYLLQAKLALISLNPKEAQKFLTQGQHIAEKYSLDRLAIKISNEHDELLKQLDVWKKLKETKAPVSERMKLARLNDQVERMIRKQEIPVPELADEEPIVLLIISEGGRPVFSESFVEEWAFEDHLFGGFLTAINSFSGEMFSEGLNRANFGEYTIIMNSLHPFLVCYLFKGQSYLAQQRVIKFIDNVKEDTTIWKTFNEYNQSCRLVQLEDIPSLEPLINKIFIDKSIPLIT